MEQERKVQEIGFKHAAAYVLRHWRVLIAVGLILGLLLGVYQIADTVQTWSNEQTAYRKATEEYAESLTIYERQKEQLESDLETYRADAEKQADYLKKSILMNMDANNKMQVTADILVMLDDSIWSKYGNAAYDPTDSLIALYGNAVTAETDWEQLATANQIEVEYIKELIAVTPQLSNNMLTLTVSHPDATVASALLHGILESIQNKNEHLQNKVFQHTLVILEDEPRKTVDANLKLLQADAKAMLNGYNSNFDTAKTTLKSLAEPVPPSAPSLARAGIKALLSAIIGFVVGVCAVGAYQFFRYFCSDTVYSEAEFADANHLRVLGNIASQKKRRLLPCVDGRIGSFAGEDADLTPKQRQEILLYNTERALGDAQTVLLTGGAPESEMQQLQTVLGDRFAAVTFTVQSNLKRVTEIGESLKKADCVLLVEKIGTSSYTEIEKTTRMIEENGKSIDGCVLV